MTDVLKIARELVAINSENPPADVSALGGWIYTYLKEIGRKPQRQYLASRRQFNVVSPGGGELLITGHMDTVPVGNAAQWKHSPYGNVKQGKLYGRGSADTKGNIAALLAALENEKETLATIALTAIEEKGMDGIEQLMRWRREKLRRIRYGITLEPTRGRIMHMSKGQYTFQVEAYGKAGHASRPDEGVNAIEKLAGCVPKLQRYYRQLKKKKYGKLGPATLSIGMINGGSASNVIPDRAHMLIDRRVLPNERKTGITREFRRVCHPLETRLIRQIDAAETPADSKIIGWMQEIHRSRKLDSRLYACTGTTELSVFRKHGIEGIIYGWGSLQQAHRIDEYVKIRDLQRGREVLGQILQVQPTR